MEEAAKMKDEKTVDEEMADLFDDTPKHQELPWVYKIWDTNQKFIFLKDSTLVAAPQQNSNSEVQLLSMIPNQALDSSKRPLFMGTKDKKYLLSVKSGDRPQLQLVAGDIMELYVKKEKSMEFTFFNQTKGSEKTCSFESAASPGWFLSTASESNKPLGLSQGGGSDITLFYIERKV